MKAKIILAWYDLWVGAFWDQNKKVLYVALIPTIVIVLNFRAKL